MERRPSAYDVAQRAGVSTATVSRVLAGGDRVRAATSEKVLAAVAELGYVPSGAAKDLAARHTGVLGLCFPDAKDHGDSAYWFDEVIRGMERAARRGGYATLIAASHEGDDAGLVLAVAGHCDGLVVVTNPASLTIIERIAMRIPVVMLATQRDLIDPAGAVDYLTVANTTGAYEMTSHLADVHHYREIGFITGLPEAVDSADRLDGFRKALADRDLVPAGLYEGDFTTDGGRRAALAMLGRGPVPRAVFCANDQTASGAMAALQAAGLRIPADVAVTGFDGIQLGRHLRPSLTTVAQPMALIGETAVKLLTDRIGGATPPPRSIELPTRLELRASCGCPDPS
jgi:LacI family transcriptional regulator